MLPIVEVKAYPYCSVIRYLFGVSTRYAGSTLKHVYDRLLHNAIVDRGMQYNLKKDSSEYEKSLKRAEISTCRAA